jgi:two-component system, sensor histidine kinase LadS
MPRNPPRFLGDCRLDWLWHVCLGLIVWMMALGSVLAQRPSPNGFQLPSIFAENQQLELDVPLGVLALPSVQNPSPDELLSSVYSSQFKAWQPGVPLPTSASQHVWLRLQLPVQDRPQSWMFRIPRLTLEKATLYQRLPSNPSQWQQQVAGMHVPNSSWPVRSRDPIFEISTRSDQTQVFFLRLEHALPVTESPQLIHSSDFGNGANYAGTLNGLIIGAFLVLTVIGLISWRMNRNPHFAWFALFCLTVMLAQLTVSGHMFLRIWPHSSFMALTMGWVTPLLALAALARLAVSVSYARDLSKPIFYSLWAVIGACALLSGVVLMQAHNVPRLLLNIFYAGGMLVILSALSWIAWRSQHWLWMVVVSIIPVILSVMARLAYNLGWVAHMELAMLAGVMTAALGLVGIYATLVNHQRLRLVSMPRHNPAHSVDIATGLFNERIAHERLPRFILRSKRYGQPCGALLVRWIHCDDVLAKLRTLDRGRVLGHLGSRLGRLARDIDTVARLGDDQFIYLVEAPITREQLNELASKILTTCLRPSPTLPDEKGFDLHLAIWISNEVPADAPQVFEMLKTRIDQMRDGTQRRVQFIDTSMSTSPANEKQQAQTTQQLVDKINSLEATQGLPRIALKPRAALSPASQPPE